MKQKTFTQICLFKAKIQIPENISRYRDLRGIVFKSKSMHGFGFRQSLSSVTQHAMSRINRRKVGSSFNTMFPLRTLLYAGYSVKLKEKIMYVKSNVLFLLLYYIII